MRVVLILALLWQSAFGAAGPLPAACGPVHAGEACACCPLCRPTAEGCACCAGEPAPEPVAPAAAGPSRAPLEPALPVPHHHTMTPGPRPDDARAPSRRDADARHAPASRRLAQLCVRVV